MTTAEQTSRYMTIAEVAEELAVSTVTVRRRIRSGELPAVQLGGPGSAVRVPRAFLTGWLYEERRG